MPCVYHLLRRAARSLLFDLKFRAKKITVWRGSRAIYLWERRWLNYTVNREHFSWMMNNLFWAWIILVDELIVNDMWQDFGYSVWVLVILLHCDFFKATVWQRMFLWIHFTVCLNSIFSYSCWYWMILLPKCAPKVTG